MATAALICGEGNCCVGSCGRGRRRSSPPNAAMRESCRRGAISMNALLLSLLALELAAMPPDEIVAKFEDKVHTYSGGEYKQEPFHYRLLKPATIKPGEKYPIILFLHGAG